MIAPAWGTAEGAWTRIAEAWPGIVEVYLGAGLGDRLADDSWTIDDDVGELAELVSSDDVLIAPGWSAELGLRAAAHASPFTVMLWTPPVGVDLSDSVIRAEAEPSSALELMASFGGAPGYWQRLKDASWARVRALTYLEQDPISQAASVPRVPVFAGWPGAPPDSVPQDSVPPNWHWLPAADAGEAALRLLRLIEQGWSHVGVTDTG